MKNELQEGIITEFAALRAKICSYLTDKNNEDEEAKGTKSVS